MKHLFKIYNFKKLNKTRKAFFLSYCFLGIAEIVFGIMMYNIAAIVLGIVCIFEAIDLFFDQSNSDIIDDYENMVEKMHNCYKKYLETTIEILKSKDENLKNNYLKMLEVFLEEEEKNDIE